MSRRPEAVLDVMGLKLHVARECRRRLRNWPVVVAKIGIPNPGSNRGAFTAVTRSGAIVQAPNVVGSRDPIIEVLGCDAYHLDSTRWEDQAAAIHVLDIGAHVGSFTCAVAAKLPRARFTCVEPSASARSWLTKNGSCDVSVGRWCSQGECGETLGGSLRAGIGCGSPHGEHAATRRFLVPAGKGATGAVGRPTGDLRLGKEGHWAADGFDG